MIQKRGTSYGVRIYRDGRQQWVGTFDTLREARRAERDALTTPTRGAGETCDAFALRWPRDYARPSEVTNRLHRDMLKPFVRDFAGVPLSAVERPQARAWALQHPASTRFVQTMFADAVRDGIVPMNPWVGLRPKRSHGRRDLEALTESELARLGDVALGVHGPYGPTMRAMIVFSGYVGLRLGQLMALRWTDISGDEVRLIAQKGAPSHLAVIPPSASEALAAMPRRLDVPWVFVGRVGRPLTKGSHFSIWDPVRAAFGRPNFPWHGLRHTAATLLLELGLDHEAVRIQLGHASVREVQDTYGHPSHELARGRIRQVFDERVTSLRAVRSRVDRVADE
jgi:integrase